MLKNIKIRFFQKSQFDKKTEINTIFSYTIVFVYYCRTLQYNFIIII